MLLDLLIRKITKQKFISSENRSLSLLDVQASTLSIVKKFEQVLNETAIKSGISVKSLNFNPVPISKAIAGQIINGKFSEISKTLYSSAKEACPEFKQTGKFLAQLKSHLKEMVDEKVLLNQQDTLLSSPKPRASATVIESKEPSTFLNGTLIAKGLSYAERAKA